MPITLAMIAVGLAVSGIMAGASYIYQRFTQKPLNTGDNNFEINPTDTRAHLPVPYGRVRIGASRIFTKTDPDDINNIYAVYACCHGEIGDVEKIWFDKEKVIDYTSESLSKNDGYVWDRWSHNGELDVEINIKRGSFNPSVYGDLQDIFGDDQWTDYHLGAGVASIQVKLHLPSALEDRQKVFAAGFPNEISLQLKGMKVQDIRQKLIVRSCETAWSYSAGSVSISTITGKVGTNAVRATVGAGAGTNTLLFADNFADKDLSSYNAIALWFRSSVNTDAGDLKLLMGAEDDCANPIRSKNLPHFDANKWKRVIIDINPDDTDLWSDNSLIKSIGIKQVTDIGICTLDIDDIWATIYAFDYVAATALVEDCEDAWLAASSAVNCTTTTGKHGNAARAIITDLANNSIIMTEVISSQSFADYTAIKFWIRSSVKTHQGDLQFLIDNSAQCASPLLTLDIPALKADKWKKVELTFPNPLILTGIISIGIKLNSKIHGDSDKRLGAADVAYTIDIDDVYVIEHLTIGTNPALCAYDYITHPVYGDGAEPSEMIESTFITEANYCDEVVSSPLEIPGVCTASVIKDEYGLLDPESWYRFKISYIRSDGSESKVGPASNKVKTSKTKNRQIKLTNIPFADAEDIVQRKIYATKGFKSGSGGTYYLYKTIGNNKDDTLDVNFTDTDLTDAAPTNVSITKNMKRFTCNGIIDTAREIKTNLEDLLTSCRGNIVYEGGKYSIFIRKVTTAETAIALTEDNIIGDWKWSMPAAKEMANIIKASYINQNKGYETDYIVWPKAREINQYLIDDNYFENIKEINLNFTVDAVRAKQIAMVVLKESRNMIKASCKCKEDVLMARVGNVIPVSHSTPSWTAKPFWFEGLGIAQDGTMLASMSSYTAADYTYDTITEDDEESTSEDIPAMEDEATESAGATTTDLGDPPAITGLEIIHNRGNESTMSGSDFEVHWDAVTEKKESSKYAISAYSSDDYYSDMTSYSSEGIRYFIEVFFIAILSSVKINNVPVSTKIAYSEITTKLTFKFSLADNIEAAKKMWKNHSTHADYDTYYGVPQRQIKIRIATLNEKNRKSVYKYIILTNPAPDMNDSTGVNTAPVLKALKSGVRVKFIHPYQEYDISHFMVQYAEDAAFTVNLKKIRISSAITLNSTDDELDSTHYTVNIEGLDPKKTYYVRVRPHDTYGAGTFSATASIAPGVTDDDEDADIVKPLTITGLGFNVLANGKLRGYWTLLSAIDITEYIYDLRAVNDTSASSPPTLAEIDDEVTAGGKACYGKIGIIMLSGSNEAVVKNQFVVDSPLVDYQYFFRVRAKNSSRKLGDWQTSGGNPAWTTHSTAVPGMSSDNLPQKWAMYKFISPGAVEATSATQIKWTGGANILKKKTNLGSNDVNINNSGRTNYTDAAIAQTVTGTRFLCYIGTANLALKTEAQLDADATFVAIAKCTAAPSGKCNVLMMISSEHFRIAAYEAGFNKLSSITADLGSITAGDLTLEHDTGSFILMKDSAGTKRIFLSTQSGSKPVLRISKATKDASTALSADDCLFTSEDNSGNAIETFKVVNKGSASAAFVACDGVGGNPAPLAAGTVLEQVVTLSNYGSSSNLSVFGFALYGTTPSDWLRVMPFTLYTNGNSYTEFEIAYSPSNTSIVCVRRIWNTAAAGTYNPGSITLTVNWSLRADVLS